MTRHPVLSVIVPVYARSYALHRALRSMATKALDGQDMEVIVVENKERINEAWLHERAWPFQLRYEFVEDGNQSRCRNVGASLARAPYLLFADSDVRFGAGALELLLNEAQQSRGRLVMADVFPHPGRPRTLATSMFDVPVFFRGYRRQRARGELTFREFVSCAFVVDAESFFDANGFDGGFVHYGYEDVEFALRWERRGLSIELSRGRAFHHKHLDPAAVLARAAELGRSAVHFVRRHPDIETTMPLGVADVRSSLLTYSSSFDVDPLMDQASAIEVELSAARRAQPRGRCPRRLVAHGRALYREIARYGRYQGILAELSAPLVPPSSRWAKAAWASGKAGCAGGLHEPE